MKNILTLFSLLSITVFSSAQSTTDYYSNYISIAESYFEAKDYKASAMAYSDAFKSNDWKGYSNDRYNAACAWALAGIPDSAFYNLDRIVTKSNYTDLDHITNDADLNSLHDDKRWAPLIEIIRINKAKAEASLNLPLAHKLDSIYVEDQKYRKMIDEYRDKYGNNSKEMKDLWKIIQEKDSFNLIEVSAILDKYGWLGPMVVGGTGNNTLFLVIQHSDLKTQEKYLPMMKDAVAKNNAYPSQLALLIDRIEMRNGRPQVYGSQINTKDGKNVVYEIIDEKNVNKRRAEVGLEPLENYVRHWGIEYKLPE
jgi:hypothetical protein